MQKCFPCLAKDHEDNHTHNSKQKYSFILSNIGCTDYSRDAKSSHQNETQFQIMLGVQLLVLIQSFRFETIAENLRRGSQRFCFPTYLIPCRVKLQITQNLREFVFAGDPSKCIGFTKHLICLCMWTSSGSVEFKGGLICLIYVDHILSFCEPGSPCWDTPRTHRVSRLFCSSNCLLIWNRFPMISEFTENLGVGRGPSGLESQSKLQRVCRDPLKLVVRMF